MSDLSKLGKAVFAGFVADAASLPLHWHYDVNAMREIVKKEGKLKTPEFLSPMATQYYSSTDFPGHYDLGQLSCYSEQAVMTLEYFEETKGKFLGGESFAQFIFKWFTNYTGRPDHPTKEFLESAKKLDAENKPLFPEAGADDIQTMHSFKVPIVALALMNGDEETYLKAVDEASRAHQNTPLISHFGKAYALILKNISEGKSLADVVESMIKGEIEVDAEVKSALEYVFERRSVAEFDEDGWDKKFQDYGTEMTAWLYEKYGGGENLKPILGLTCRFPGAFMVGLKCVLDTLLEFPNVDDFKTKGYAFGVRRNILFGGDNCGRTFIVGPLLSLSGADIPDDFMSKINKEDFDKYAKLISTVSS